MALRGYFALLDSFAALSLAALVLLLIASYGPVPPVAQPSQPAAYARDFLDSAYRTGVLSSALHNDTQAVRGALLGVPDQYCPSLAVYASDGTLVSSIARPSCVAKGRQLAVAYKSFADGPSFYVASFSSWYP